MTSPDRIPSMAALVAALSADVVARLANRTNPYELTYGSIQISRAHVWEAGAPNRIVMIPTYSDFAAKDVSSASNVVGYPSPEILQEWTTHVVQAEFPAFVVQCWGQANPPDPDGGDFDVTAILYQTMIASARSLVSGSRVKFTPRGVWLNQKPDGSVLDCAGTVFEFGMRFDRPVVDEQASGSIGSGTPKPTVFARLPGQPPPGAEVETG